MPADRFQNISDRITCPSCGKEGIMVSNYTSLMVLRRDLGLFSIECPNCSVKIFSIHPIPPYLSDEIALAAKEVGAGMGSAD